MFNIKSVASSCTLLLAASGAVAQATAFRGTHVGFTTTSGQAGQQLDLRTGYGTSGAPESEAWAFRFDSVAPGVRQLQTRSDRFASNQNAPFAQASYNLWNAAPSNWRSAENGGGVSPVNGWFAQSSTASNPVTQRQTFNATGGDAFVATGNLVGGSFAYEITAVTPLNGSAPASFAIGMLINPSGNTDDSLRQLQGTNTVGTDTFDVFGLFSPALAEGGTLADRSIYLGNGNHFHGWGFFVSQPGVYEVAMRAYDVNGRYTPSETFTFQINSIPSPSNAATMAAVTLLATGRRRRRM